MDFSILMKIDYTVYWIIAIMYVAVMVTYFIRPNGLFKLDWITFGLHTALIVFRWIEAGHPPYQNLYEYEGQIGYAAALSVLLFVIVFGITVVNWSLNSASREA